VSGGRINMSDQENDMSSIQALNSQPESAGLPTPTREALTTVHIAPSPGWVSLRLGELWAHRELLYFLVWRDIKVRYKQTMLGVAWAIIQPVLAMVVFSLFFGRLAKMPSDGVPYPIFCYAAMVPWTFFSYGLTQASASLVSNASLLTKVYFPRLAIPTAKVLSGLLDFVLSFVVLLLMMWHYGIYPTAQLIWLPAFILLALATALGAALWLSAMYVTYRDIGYILPFVTQIWMFATPIVYPSSLLKEPWRTLYGLNPMVGVVEGFRWALLGTNSSAASMMGISSLIAVILLVGGAYYFRHMEKSFADVV
jgi:lipopolysaccharide transport system permease protein